MAAPTAKTSDWNNGGNHKNGGYTYGGKVTVRDLEGNVIREDPPENLDAWWIPNYHGPMGRSRTIQLDDES